MMLQPIRTLGVLSLARTDSVDRRTEQCRRVRRDLRRAVPPYE